MSKDFNIVKDCEIVYKAHKEIITPFSEFVKIIIEKNLETNHQINIEDNEYFWRLVKDTEKQLRELK